MPQEKHFSLVIRQLLQSRCQLFAAFGLHDLFRRGRYHPELCHRRRILIPDKAISITSLVSHGPE